VGPVRNFETGVSSSRLPPLEALAAPMAALASRPDYADGHSVWSWQSASNDGRFDEAG